MPALVAALAFGSRAILMIALALLALAAAGPAFAAEPAVLRVGTSGDYAPFSQDGRGFDVEVARRMAPDLGVEIAWVPFRWPELSARLAAGDFDVAMSGVTWRPDRAVVGWMSSTVARGGPCVLGAAAPPSVGVNRGGVLERFARVHFPRAEIRAVDRNDLAGLLERHEVAAVVTDSFEAPELMNQRAVREQPLTCEPALDRKVYWVAPQRAAELGPRIDGWLARHESEVDALRARWLGGSAPRRAPDDLLDLLARRLALMPAVARWKRARGLAIEDPAREARVVAAAHQAAVENGLEPAPVEALFRLQIALGSRLQATGKAPEEGVPDLDLESQLRPELTRLGARIVSAAASVAPLDPAALDAADWATLAQWLDAPERAELRGALLALRPAPPKGGGRD
ncbi:MAG TPA: transporter substrate-binding domain-containing protein [Myxococcota bacterium]|nr:transporter substrate-binding domain-containing protein [Myxococcota bacterium]